MKGVTLLLAFCALSQHFNPTLSAPLYVSPALPAGPLVLPAPPSPCYDAAVPGALAAVAPLLPTLAPPLANTITTAIAAALPPLLESALPTVLTTVLSAAGPLLEAAVPCGAALGCAPAGYPCAPAISYASACPACYGGALSSPLVYASAAPQVYYL